jgi:ABC-type multidrug transport system ATPase subunit
MRIDLSNAGKRFNREWIFRRADVSFEKKFHTALTGPNGSGKSTMLQCIAGMLDLSEGKLAFEGISNEMAYNEISFCAPYLELIEEMTLLEFFEFHTAFKPLLPGISIKQMVVEITLEAATHKQIRYFSSGMKQRARLAQAIFSNTAIVLLDEPCSNLDEAGIALYHSLIEKYCKDRLVIVCSNDPVEYSFCERIVKIPEYK